MTTLQDIVDAHAAFLAKAREATSDLLAAYFAPIFAMDARIEALVWGQWAPYFNDGEPCEFGIQNECVVRGEACERPRPYEGRETDPLYHELGKPGPVSEANRAANALLRAIPLEVLRTFCADGVIQITRAGEVQILTHYEHD